MSISISIHILFLSAFTLVAEKHGCVSKNDKFAGSFINITLCAEACKNESTMFLFGRSDGSRCNVDGKCRCKCILGASLNGSCLYEPRNGYNLYRNNIAAVCKSSEICVIRGWGFLYGGTRILGYFLNGIRKNCICFGRVRKIGILMGEGFILFNKGLQIYGGGVPPPF